MSAAATTPPSKPLIGTVFTLPGVATAELLAEPFDVVWIDLEHGALSVADAAELMIGVQAAGSRALVRLPSDAHGLLTVVLDAGADGAVLADVTDPEDARRAVDKATHPPHGSRGWGPRRLGTRGRSGQRSTSRPLIWAQIESQAGVELAAEIAAVDGVDLLVVGTADLSFSIGEPLRFDSELLLSMISTVRQGAFQSSSAFGLAGPLDAIPDSALVGATALIHSTEARIAAAAVDRAVEDLRRRAEGLRMQPDGETR